MVTLCFPTIGRDYQLGLSKLEILDKYDLKGDTHRGSGNYTNYKKVNDFFRVVELIEEFSKRYSDADIEFGIWVQSQKTYGKCTKSELGRVLPYYIKRLERQKHDVQIAESLESV